MTKRPLTILGVHPGNVVNGGLLGCLEIAAFLKESGHTFLLATDGEGEASVLARKQGLRVIPTSIPRWFCGFRGQSGRPDPKMIVRFFKGYRRGVNDLVGLIQSEHVDVVLANTSPAIVGLLAGNKAHCPVLCHVRETMPDQSRWGKAHTKFLSTRSQKIVVNSDSSAAPFKGITNWTKIYDGLDSPVELPSPKEVSQWKKSLQIEESRPVVGVLGGVSKIKGHFLFFDLLPRLVALVPDVMVVFMGPKPPAKQTTGFRGTIRELITGQNLDVDRIVASAGVEDNVRFAGWVDDPFLALAGINVLAFPSIIPEGFGRPLVEAALLEKPVVAFDHGPSPEIVESGSTGLLVPTGQVEDFAEALADLLNNEEMATKMGICGRKRVVKNFPLKGHMENILSELQCVSEMKVPSGLGAGDGIFGLLVGGDTGNGSVAPRLP